jgi:CubicO group peptidase (beta-lactamase class C family)
MGISVSITAGMRLLRFVLAIALGTLAFGAAAQTPEPRGHLDLTAENLADVIDPLMAAWVEQHKGPGAVVVVVTRDATIFAKGYGLADIEAKRPFTTDATLVRPGSISKLFTGIAVMQLVDAGKLDLDRDVNGYIDFAIPTPDGGVPVTLRRLLTHRAGFEERIKGLFSRDPPVPLRKWLADGLPHRLFPKGDVAAYSNYGFVLAGYIVERVSGEPFETYIQRHILDPLGMSHSTFQQPLPDGLAGMAAKPYRRSDQPPIVPFETIPAPAGALSATADDMSRFLRMLMNGGELDGVRILPKARLDEMMAPQSSSPAGYLGLVFFGKKIAGRNAIGHDGETMAFFSQLDFFPADGVGIFVSRDGIGDVKTAREIPNIAPAVARRFLSEPPRSAGGRAPVSPEEANIAGSYHPSRRAESSFVRLRDLISERIVRIDGDGNARLLPSIWPFGEGTLFRRIGSNLYAGPGRLAYVEGESGSYIDTPAIQLQRLPSYLDARWILPILALSVLVMVKTLLGWPFAALWRRWRNKRFSESRADVRLYRTIRLVLLLDIIVILAVTILFSLAIANPTILNDALDFKLVALYIAAWIGVLGAIAVVLATLRFWRNGVGSRWSRIHHTLLAASSVMIAWLFVVFRIAGTTLNY